MTRRRRLILAAAAVPVVLGLAVLLRLHHVVHLALETPPADTRPAQWAAAVRPPAVPAVWTGGDVESIVATGDEVLVAGAFGAVRGDQAWDLACGLSSIQAQAASAWRGQPVLALASGGIFRLRGSACEELRSGFGTLHARVLHETSAGELIVAAREGLFRLPWGAAKIERLAKRSTRACVSLDTEIIAGTEEGLYRVTPSGMILIETPDPWIETVALLENELIAITAAGLARGPIGGPLVAVPGGEEIAQGTVHDGRFYGASDPPRDTLLFLTTEDQRLREEGTPTPARRAFSVGDALWIDTPRGLYRRTSSGWRLVRPRGKEVLPPGPTHITALAATHERIVAGLFDAGLRVASTAGDGSLTWSVPQGSAAWAINALLDAGGATFVASLRGLAHLDGEAVRPVPSVEGAAFALLSTPAGLVVGQGLGVRMPNGRLISAFHGLPGNQATALALDHGTIVVGTPSGLGALRGSRVVWSVHPGEGRLPHPWITAMAEGRGGLYVGTYGGGVFRRITHPGDPPSDPGTFETFVETEGLRVNANCLVADDTDVFLGTEARGLWRLRAGGSRFERVSLPLPGPRVTALAWQGQALLVGTDEGLARIDLGHGGRLPE